MAGIAMPVERQRSDLPADGCGAERHRRESADQPRQRLDGGDTGTSADSLRLVTQDDIVRERWCDALGGLAEVYSGEGHAAKHN